MICVALREPGSGKNKKTLCLCGGCGGKPNKVFLFFNRCTEILHVSNKVSTLYMTCNHRVDLVISYLVYKRP